MNESGMPKAVEKCDHRPSFHPLRGGSWVEMTSVQTVGNGWSKKEELREAFKIGYRNGLFDNCIWKDGELYTASGEKYRDRKKRVKEFSEEHFDSWYRFDWKTNEELQE